MDVDVIDGKIFQLSIVTCSVKGDESGEKFVVRGFGKMTTGQGWLIEELEVYWDMSAVEARIAEVAARKSK